MSKQDFYELLGVAKNASEADIKKAYRRKAMKYHPDRNPDNPEAETKFKEIKEAYDILSDSKKRAAYDQFGHAGVDPSQGGGGFGGFGGGGAGFEFNDLGDIFGDIFGDAFGGRGRSRQSGPRAERGSDLVYNLTIDLEDAVHGKNVEISIPTWSGCKSCNGSGAKKGSKAETCKTCDGHGQVRMQQGFFTVQQTCPDCHGEGQVIKDPCSDCHGQGRIRENRRLSVKIPSGIDNEDRIRLSGEGEAGIHGGGSGDLYVQVAVRPHNVFERHGQDLYCEIPVDFTVAALGGELEVPTLDGKVKLKIPAETQSGKQFRIRGKGVKPIRHGSHGDLICKVLVETPAQLTNDQKDLLKRFQKSLDDSGIDHSPKAQSWFDRVKRFFENRTS